jgi:sec-independent protein translocase protein TatB
MKRHAAEFRAQFDEAMREAELDQIKKDVENIKSEAEASLRSAETSVADELSNAKRELETAGDTSSTASANGHGSVAAPEGEGIQGPVIIPDEPAPQETAAAPAEPAAPASSSPAHFNGSSGSSGEDTPAGKSGV